MIIVSEVFGIEIHMPFETLYNSVQS
jgi:hypothetical protein